MKKTHIKLALLTLSLFFHQPIYSSEMNHKRIASISLNEKDLDSRIKQQLKTKVGALFLDQDFDLDIKNLALEFQSIDVHFDQKEDGLHIDIVAISKPLIQSVVIQGNVYADESVLRRELGITPKTPFDEQQFKKALNKLERYYAKKGFFEAKIHHDISYNEDKSEISITITIDEGRGGKIEEIRFHNMTEDEEKDLVKQIFTKEYSLFTSWFTREGFVNNDILNHDEMTISNFFKNRGYADVNVTIKTVPIEGSEKVFLDIIIDRKEPYTFGKIVTTGMHVGKEEDIKQRISIKEGTVYSPEELRDIQRAIKEYYERRGYIDAIIEYTTTLDDELSHVYNVHFTIREGDQYRVGLVKVFGNTRTQTPVVLHETLLVPGDIFNGTLLQKTEERLLNVGYFSNVNVYPVESTIPQSVEGALGKTRFRDVHIDVEELANTARFTTSVGFSSAQNIFGSIGLEERNFSSTGVTSVTQEGFRALRGGGEYLSLNATIGTKQRAYTLSWTKPYFLDSEWTIGIDLSRSRVGYASDKYSLKEDSLELHGYYNINAFLKFDLQYRLTHSSVSMKHKSHGRLRRESNNSGVISAIGPGLLYDSTDSPYGPKRGVRSNLSAEYAGLFGDYKFLRFSYRNSLFWSPYEFGIFRLRGNFEHIHPFLGTRLSKLPLGERLYLGGEWTLRGYGYNRVGPQFRDKDKTPRGGATSILFSLDYDQYCSEKIDLFVFFDAGNVYFKKVHPEKLYYSSGCGIKFKVLPNVPLIFGVGFPLNPKHKRDVRHFYFSMGASF